MRTRARLLAAGSSSRFFSRFIFSSLHGYYSRWPGRPRTSETKNQILLLFRRKQGETANRSHQHQHLIGHGRFTRNFDWPLYFFVLGRRLTIRPEQLLRTSK